MASVTEKRKSDHVKICLNKNVESGSTGFEDILLIHNALPEIDFSDIDTSTNFFGKELSMPLMIAGMVGGTKEGEKINRVLASVAEKKGIGFGLGSQRAMIEKPHLAKTYFVRDVAPSVLLFGNIGITQAKQYPVERIEEALIAVKANALCVHINPAQEIFQRKGDLNFSGCLNALKKLCKRLKCPVVAKEVGKGISRDVALKLKKTGIASIDIGGYGGTDWSRVEIIRNRQRNLIWVGIPTACSILEAKTSKLPIIATGGVRNGFDIAKAIALGASLTGIALPFLRLAKKGKRNVENYIDNLQRELKIAMFLCGCKNIKELKSAEYVLRGFVKSWKEQREL